jgi:hypothetical protein
VSTVPVVEAGAELAGAELAGAELAGAELAGAEADVLAALLHAAAASTEAAGIASLSGFGSRASSEWILFIVSSWAGWRPQQLLDEVITAMSPQRLDPAGVSCITSLRAMAATRGTQA